MFQVEEDLSEGKGLFTTHLKVTYGKEKKDKPEVHDRLQFWDHATQCSQDSKYHCKQVKIQPPVVGWFSILTCLSEITTCITFVLGREAIVGRMFVSNTYTLSSL